MPLSINERIATMLADSLSPERLQVIDESAAHAGHAGAAPGGETHFRVVIVAAAFAGLGRVARHRLVNQAVAPLMGRPIHALAIEARAPGEPPT